MRVLRALCVLTNRVSGTGAAARKRHGRASLGTSVLQTQFVESLCMSMDYLWVHVSLCILEKGGGGGTEEGSLLRLKVLWYSSMFKHVLRILQSVSFAVPFPWERGRRPRGTERGPPLESLGTGGVGHGVGHGFLRVAAIVVNLEEDGTVHKDLQQAARPELHRGLGEQEVDGFKGVAARPHQHHLNAWGDMRGVTREKSQCGDIRVFEATEQKKNTLCCEKERWKKNNVATKRYTELWFVSTVATREHTMIEVFSKSRFPRRYPIC